MIRLTNINKHYQVVDQPITVLEDVNLHITTGELLAIMGPSGSGKTTLMNILGLMDNPDSGSYLLDQKEISEYTPDEFAHLRNQMFGYIFQLFFLLPRLTALQNVYLPLMYREMSMEERRERALIAMQKVGVGNLVNNRPYQMSGGQQQRVAIARALVGQPKIILADEPTGALDSKTGQDVMDLLNEINTQEGATIIIITHDAHIASQCRRVVRIADGRLIAETE